VAAFACAARSPPTTRAAFKSRCGTSWRDFGVDRGDPTTWWRFPVARGVPGLKHHSLQQQIATQRLSGAIADLLGKYTWAVPKSWGSVLVSLPSTKGEAWTLPADIWHLDSRLGENVGALRRVFVFTVFASLAERGGATLVLEGSHRLLMHFHEGLSRKHRNFQHKWHRQQFLKWDPWLERLAAHDESADRIEIFMGHDSTVQDVSVRVRELTGEPGDAWLCHPLMVHGRSPCTGTAPRFAMAKMVMPKGEANADAEES
jgi:hypothetical protein